MELVQMPKSSTRNPLVLNQNIDKPKLVGNLLEKWIAENRSKSELNPINNFEVFTDPDGVLRYTHNWMPATVETESLLSRTGCVEMSIDYLFLKSHSDSEKVRFIADWKPLWDYLENDKIDEIATQAPLLRIYVEFFFHRRTAHFQLFLSVYHVVLRSFLFAFFPIMITPGGFALTIVSNVCQGAIYMSMRYLYKGAFLGDDPHSTPPENTSYDSHEEQSIKENKPRSIIYLYSNHWSSTFAQIFKQTFREIKSFFITPPNNANSHHKHNSKKISFYTLLNLSLKFLTRHQGMTVADINFNRVTYRLGLIFILCGLPFYLYFNFYFMDAVNTIKACNHNWNSAIGCQYAKYSMIFTVCDLSMVIMHYIFASSVVVALVGLAYGGEIAYRLSDSWIKRFEQLRRLPLPTTQEGKQDKEAPKEIQSATENILLIGDNDDRKTDITSSSRQVSTVSMRPAAHSAFESEVHPETLLLLPLISRDATEHYLFVREYISQASRIWSLGISGMFVIFLYIIISFLYNYITYEAVVVDLMIIIIKNVVYITTRFCILVIYPIVSLSHANSFVYALQESFLVASQEDFAVIGGRDLWIDFLASAPAVWTFYGLWITWDKLFAFLWAVLSACAAVALTYISTI